MVKKYTLKETLKIQWDKLKKSVDLDVNFKLNQDFHAEIEGEEFTDPIEFDIVMYCLYFIKLCVDYEFKSKAQLKKIIKAFRMLYEDKCEWTNVESFYERIRYIFENNADLEDGEDKIEDVLNIKNFNSECLYTYMKEHYENVGDILWR